MRRRLGESAVRILASFVIVLALSGCGTKGPLYLVGDDGRPRKTEGSPGLRPPVP